MTNKRRRRRSDWIDCLENINIYYAKRNCQGCGQSEADEPERE
jgi:hypothetical protein